MIKTPILTIIKRLQYKGGRKFKSAYKKFLDKHISELQAAGVDINVLLPKEAFNPDPAYQP